MNNFRKDPEILLADKASTLAALENPTWMDSHPLCYNVKSQWLCDLLDEKERAEGFQYNLQFQRWLEKEHGIGPFNENSSPLSILIYNAQSYRRSDALRRAGFQPLTQDMIDEAARTQRSIELEGENMLGGRVRASYKVRHLQGKNYLMPPRSRNKCVPPQGQPARFSS